MNKIEQVKLLCKARVIARGYLSLGDYTESEVEEVANNLINFETKDTLDELFLDVGDTQDIICYQLAKLYHKGQIRNAGLPYINHCERVAEVFRGDAVLYGIAILHDIIEDTDMTFEILSEWVPIEIANGVRILTHPKNEYYFDYIRRVKLDKNATKIKIADMLDNILDKPTKHQLNKYKRAIQILID